MQRAAFRGSGTFHVPALKADFLGSAYLVLQNFKLVVDKERHWNSGSMDGIRGSGFNPRPNTDSQTGIQNQTGFNEAFHLHLNLQLS